MTRLDMQIRNLGGKVVDIHFTRFHLHKDDYIYLATCMENERGEHYLVQ